VPLVASILTLLLFALLASGLLFYGVRYLRGGIDAKRTGGRFTFGPLDGRHSDGKSVSGDTAYALGIALCAVGVGSFVLACMLVAFAAWRTG
jgi:hypothetical protein